MRMKSSGINLFGELSRSLTRLLRMGNGLISHTGTPRYTACKKGLTIRLEKGELHTMPADRCDQMLTVQSGIFWVTQENNSHDYVLKTGESLSLSGKGIVVIEALQSGVIELQES